MTSTTNTPGHCEACGGRGEIDVSPPYAVSPDYAECGPCEGTGGVFCDACECFHAPVESSEDGCTCDEVHRSCCPVMEREARFFAGYFASGVGPDMPREADKRSDAEIEEARS